VNVASESLPLQEGDEVLVLGNEYPANLLPWLKKKKDGITVTIIKGTDSPAAFESLLETISEKTKAITISSAQYYDGYIMDLARLSTLCHDQGIFLVLDAVQSVGVRKIDLQETPVDFLLCGGQKYLQAGMGCGFMYINQNTLSALKDYKVGIRSMQSFDEESYVLKDTADRFQDGTQNEAGIVALHAALSRINSIGIENIEQLNYKLLGEIKSCLATYNIPFIDHSNNQGNIVSMQVSDPKALFEFLKEKSVYIKPIKDVARLSFIHESRLEDVETLAQLTRQWIDKDNQSYS
jgi:cysteine desulfurase/selenocysteine lyase